MRRVSLIEFQLVKISFYCVLDQAGNAPVEKSDYRPRSKKVKATSRAKMIGCSCSNRSCHFARALLLCLAVEFTEKARIMDPARINRALARLASEIVEENHGIDDLILVGIRRRGVPLANRIADKIQELEGVRPPVGILDITLYRDDLSTVGAKPIVSGTELPGDIEARTIVLIDDVLYTGRTVRAAMDQLIDFGRPRRVQLAVLVDRGNEHRELPIQADYIGKLVPTKKSEIIKVMLTDFDEDEGVVIVERPAAEAAA
jgi:pyrimidine operon attenuation protein / uracil phosphoribosyltransferase